MNIPRIRERLNLAIFGAILARLSKRFRPDYHRYIRSRRWRRKARKIRVRDNWTCADCGEHGWEVHHRTYARLGYELNADLVTLCRGCHQSRHDRNEL